VTGARGLTVAARRARVLLTLTLLLWGLTGCRGDGPGDAKAAAQKPGVPVTAAAAIEQDVPVQLRAIGNVQAYTTVSVLSLVGGEIFQIHFKEGQEVKRGDLLFTIDQRPFQAALEQAQATRAQHQAQVTQAEANLARDMAQLENARVEEERYRKLVERGYVAREQYDRLVTTERALAATIEADRAAVANARAVVRADDALVENAKLQLGYTVIRAPVDGRTGNVLINRGNVVKANDVGNPLVVITQVHPIYVAFSVPEQELERVKRYRATGELKVEATPPGPVSTTVRGDLTFVNNTVDQSTGTIQLKATFQNAENALWPGQFVNVTLTLTTQPRAVLVPSQAVQSGQQGSYVFVVKPDSTVEVRPVVLGLTDGRNIVIAKGVAAGEQVVTEGQLRLVPGARVDVKTAPTPAPRQGAGG
jgi:multidrug efflux system membrane fusion protein